jgi:sugar phosphate isomerase/epimerase
LGEVKLGSMYFRSPEADAAERFLAENDLDALEISLPIRPDEVPAMERRRVIACGRRLPGRVALHEVLPLGLAHRQAEFRRRITRRIVEDVRLAQEAEIGILTLHTTCTRTIRSLDRDWRISHTRWLSRALDRDVTDDYQESVKVMVELLQEVSPLAMPPSGSRVELAVENNFRDRRYFGRRIDSVDDVLDVLEKAAVPAATMCFDIFKAASTEDDIPNAIRKAGTRVVNMHASDAEPAETAFFRKRAAIGEGVIDWASVVTAIADIGYTGPIIFEMMEDARAIRESAARLRQIMAEVARDRSSGRTACETLTA